MNLLDKHQEILLLTSSGIIKRQWSEKESSQEKLQPFSGAEQLEKACWNGMLHEILPGILEEPSIHKTIFLWEIISAESFLVIQMGPCPSPIDNRASIDPYRFISTLFAN